MLGLADCNNFFVSCERVFKPSLAGRPVVVLSNNDGCVISRSNEAKALGIKMGEPVFKIMDLVRNSDVKVFSSNYVLYGDMSRRVMDSIRNMVPAIEVYSIDEAFIDFSGVSTEKLKVMGEAISRVTRRDTGIPISMGISHTKTLAKIASRLSKKYPRLNNSCFLEKDSDIRKVLSTFPVEDVWGIGRRYAKMLRNNGINTALDFCNASPEWVKSKMSIVGLKTWKELHQESCITFEDSVDDKKQICTSRSFSKELSNIEDIYQAVSYFASNCSEKLRKQKGVCSQIQVFILTNYFREDMPQCYQSIVVPIETATDSTLQLVKISCRALEQIYNPLFSYKKAGVIFSQISKKEETTGNIFCDFEVAKHTNLMSALDDVNIKYGRNTLVMAAQGVEKIKAFSNHLSKRYTTSWDDIIEVKI
ncbi:MAG: SOS mutagenesis and repair protein UmuC [Bacteroidetes bacterium GWF2_40_14]|nr:MAG: SOS mutagenesis and repair protein UmuC [Bacteroidetes bacterium GWF2_40_14]